MTTIYMLLAFWIGGGALITAGTAHDIVRPSDTFAEKALLLLMSIFLWPLFVALSLTDE